MDENRMQSDIGMVMQEMAAMSLTQKDNPYAYLLRLGQSLERLYLSAYKSGYATGSADQIIQNSKDSKNK